MSFQDLHAQILEDFVDVSYAVRDKTHSHTRMAGDFHAKKGWIINSGPSWETPDPAEELINPWDWRRRRAKGTLVRRVMKPYDRRKIKSHEILADLRQKRHEKHLARWRGAVSRCGA